MADPNPIHPFGQLRAVEVGAERNVIDPDSPSDVVDVTHDVSETALRGRVLPIEEQRGKVDADNSTRRADRVELGVREVPGRRAERMSVRVRGHKRRLRVTRDIPEARLVEVRHVDHDPEEVARADEILARLRQAGARVG